MSIEIHNPELERLLEQRLRAGNFANIEELLLDTLRRDEARSASQAVSADKGLVAFFRESPLAGLQLDLERDPDAGRDIAL